MEIQHIQGRIDRAVTVHMPTENELYSLLSPLGQQCHQNQSTKARGRADFDRKQLKEEHKRMNIDGDMALSGGG